MLHMNMNYKKYVGKKIKKKSIVCDFWHSNLFCVYDIKEIYLYIGLENNGTRNVRSLVGFSS